MKDLQKLFENPGCEYRGKPFWAWNGYLKEDELRRQIRIMKKMGLGGFFMHSRVGLGTPYLSEEWYDLVKACIDEAKKQDMEAWLYDEDRWPSGAAGGLVTKNRKYSIQFLEARISDAKEFKWDKDVLAACSARIEKGGNAYGVEPLKKGAKPAAGKSVVAFRVKTTTGSDWFNNQTYLDTLSPEAVREFIRVTHEGYRKHVGKEFGKSIPGIFTDEPNYGYAVSILGGSGTGFHLIKDGVAARPWTGQLRKVFRQRYGYDVHDHLMEIFFDVDDQKVYRARVDFLDCLTFLFSDAFARQIGEWCEKNKILHTGHALHEETPMIQTAQSGSIMRFFEHMQAPGIDVLTDNRYQFTTAKQCSSVVNQTGRKWMLSELYGCVGWDFPFEGFKTIGDWQVALGVNLRCHHLSWYTMAGQAKRDYPVSIFHHSPWWELHSTVETYFARLNAVLTQGNLVRDILVLHPIESTWVRFKVENVEELTGWDKQFEDFLHWLLEAHQDFDYGEEEMLSRIASVKRGSNGPVLRVGKAEYKAVVVPPMLTMRRSTLEILRKFSAAGGKVIFTDGAPNLVNAEPSNEAVHLARQCVAVKFESKAITKALEDVRRVSIADEKGREIPKALYMLRSDGKSRYLFICNFDRKKGYDKVVVRLAAPGHAEEWDAATGERFRADATEDGGEIVIETSLAASGSRLFVIPEKVTAGLKPRARYTKARSEPIGQATWDVTLSEPNVFVLDQPQYRIGTGKLNPRKEILKIDMEARAALRLAPRGGRMVQPWARERKANKPTVPVYLRYEFGVEAIPSGQLELAVELPERLRIRLNGYELPGEMESGWWTDRAIRCLPVDPALLLLGKNVLEVECDFDEDLDLETLFLLGDFGVRLEGMDMTIIEPKKRLKVGNWVEQGLPFFSGAVTYRTKVQIARKKGERVVLSFPKFESTVTRVWLNGKAAGIVGWPPYEVDLTDLASDGENDLAIEVISSRRNSFGPLHHNPANKPAYVSANEFVSTGEKWLDTYVLQSYGLVAKPILEYRAER